MHLKALKKIPRRLARALRSDTSGVAMIEFGRHAGYCDVCATQREHEEEVERAEDEWIDPALVPEAYATGEDPRELRP